MKYSILAAVLFSLAFASQEVDYAEEEYDKNQGKRSLDPHADYDYSGGYVSGGLHEVPAPQLVSQHVQVEKVVPVVQYQNVPVPVPHPVAVPVQVPVHVPEPVPVHVPVPVPVYRTVTVPVEKPVPYPVEKPVPVHIFKKIPVPVPKPYPVPVPIYKTKHVYHEIYHSKHNGWW